MKRVLDEAALAGFATLTHTNDAGQQVTVTKPGIPTLSFSYEWGGQHAAEKRVREHVARYTQREDDPRVQHEGAYENGY